MRTTSDAKEPSRPTVKRLFALSGNRCAFPKCTTAIIDPGSGSVVGQVCHIRGEKKGAARYDEDQTAEERHGFDNLILLCGPHHKVIDDDDETYTVDRLKAIKAKHESTATQVPEPSDEVADRLIATVWVSVSQGSIIWAPNQSGGQTAHSITNVHLGPTVPQEDQARTELRSRNLGDPQATNFGKTRYSQRLGIMGRNGVLEPLPVLGLFFALLPKRIVPRGNESAFFAWMDCNKRRYDPIANTFFLPSSGSDQIGKAHVWHDGGRQRVCAARCYTQYLAIEPDGFLEYGFLPGGFLADDIDRVYYARVVAGFVAFLRFLKDLCNQVRLDASAASIGFALRGTKEKSLRCITKRVLPQFQETSPPVKDGFLFFRPATPGTDWTVDEVARQAAEEILDFWSYSVPTGFGIPEFQGEQYEGQYFKSDFHSW